MLDWRSRDLVRALLEALCCVLELCLVLVQPGKLTHMSEKLLTEVKKQLKQKKRKNFKLQKKAKIKIFLSSGFLAHLSQKHE